MIDLDVKIDERHQRETLRRLSRMSDGLKDKVVRKGLDMAAKPLVTAMKSNFPERQGFLRKSVGKAKLTKGAAQRLGFGNLRPGEQVILVGPNKRVGGVRRARIAQILEAGAKAHNIVPKSRDGALSVNRNAFSKRVRHPGIRAQRNMERSLSDAQNGIEDRFFEGMERELNRLIA